MDETYQGFGEIEDQEGAIVDLRNRLREEVQHFTQLTPRKTYWSILWQWLVIASAFSSVIYFDHWAVYVGAMVVIAGRQHALGVLGHDGCHFRISTNRKLNGFIADIFCWLPIWYTNSRYGYEHLPHHRYVNTDKDPYVADFKSNPGLIWPKSKRDGVISLLKHFFGLEIIEAGKVSYRTNLLSPVAPSLPRQEKITAVIFVSLLLLLLWLANGWLNYLILWLLPMITITWFAIIVRTIGEHIGMEGFTGISETRHVDGSWWERMFFAP